MNIALLYLLLLKATCTAFAGLASLLVIRHARNATRCLDRAAA